MNLNDAIARIDAIQTQLQRTQTFRGYRSVAVGTTGLIACAAAVLQYWWIASPMNSVREWLVLWVSIAAVSVVITTGELVQRMYDKSSPWQARASRSALFQFVPCLCAGVAVTWALLTASPETMWVLPGIWAILFSLAVFSSLTILPNGGVVIAMYFLFAGVLCLRFGHGSESLAPWTMMITFGFGQLLSAVILYIQLERGESRSESRFRTEATDV